MSATPSEIKEALKVALKTIKGLRVTDYQPDQPNPPFAFPVLTDVAYHGAMGRGNIIYQFQVTIVAGRAAERSAQAFLDRMIAYDGGVREAIEEDRTLGGVVQDCIVLSAGNIVSITANDTTYLTVDFQVQVYG